MIVDHLENFHEQYIMNNSDLKVFFDVLDYVSFWCGLFVHWQVRRKDLARRPQDLDSSC
jgi:hypothetical protein